MSERLEAVFTERAHVSDELLSDGDIAAAI